jgi:hypothetical protein
VAEVEVGRARVYSELDPERPVGRLKHADQVGLADHLGGAPLEQSGEFGRARSTDGTV